VPFGTTSTVLGVLSGSPVNGFGSERTDQADDDDQRDDAFDARRTLAIVGGDARNGKDQENDLRQDDGSTKLCVTDGSGRGRTCDRSNVIRRSACGYQLHGRLACFKCTDRLLKVF